MNLLSLIPLPYRLLAVALIAVALMALGWTQGARHEHANTLAVQVRWDAEKLAQQQAAIAATEANAKETQRRLERQKDADDAHVQDLARAAVDAADAHAAADRLQQRADALLAAAGCSGTGDPALACVRTAAASLRDALGASAEIARRAAAKGDDARARGLQCERDYDALTQ